MAKVLKRIYRDSEEESEIARYLENVAAEKCSGAEKFIWAITKHKKRTLLVAFDDDRPVGAISYGIHPPMAKVANIGVLEERKGIGRALMTYVMYEACEAGLPVWLKANRKARGFYEKLGFVPLEHESPKAMIWQK